MSYIISLANGKGGVAKTTSCIALGSSLAEIGYRVLLIDLDSSANLTVGLGSLPEKPVDFSEDLFLSTRTASIRPVKTGYKNLDIIPSRSDIANQDGNSSALHNSTMILRGALESLSPNPYDFILLDCPASLGFLTINALNVSDLLIIPTQPEYFSAIALPNMLSTVNKIRQGMNRDLKCRILVTMLDLRLKEHRNILNQFQMHLGDSLYKIRIQIDTRFKESQTQGIPINYVMPFARGTLQYRDLAREILKNLQLTLPSASSRSRKDTVAVKKLPGNHESRLRGFQVATPDHQTHGGHSQKDEISPKTDVQSVPVTPDEGQYIQQDGTEHYCPHLGGVDDPETIQAYPSTWNKCYRANPIVSPNYTHQQIYCLSSNYRSCPMLRESSKTSLPSEARAPLDRSELLQYFKNWLKTKIS